MRRRRIIANPFACASRHPRALAGPRLPWENGDGYWRNVWCLRCAARGVLSCCTLPRSGKPWLFSGIVLPDKVVTAHGMVRATWKGK